MDESNSRKRLATEATIETEKTAESKSENGLLPLSRVKKIIKMGTNSANVSAGSTKIIQLLSEEYLRVFVKAASLHVEQAGRKTIQANDLSHVIKDDWAFALLEDTLFEWPGDENKLQFNKPEKNNANV